MSEIKEQVKTYIQAEFADEASVGSLADDTPLLSSGIIDSVSALQLVEFLETTFKIEFEAHEVDQDNLDTLDKIEAFMLTKLN